MRTHRKVWLWGGPWWSVQLYIGRYVSLGVHVDFARPYVDLHLGWLIVSIGREPYRTEQVDRHRHSCRGFGFDEPVL